MLCWKPKVWNQETKQEARKVQAQEKVTRRADGLQTSSAIALEVGLACRVAACDWPTQIGRTTHPPAHSHSLAAGTPGLCSTELAGGSCRWLGLTRLQPWDTMAGCRFLSTQKPPCLSELVVTLIAKSGKPPSSPGCAIRPEAGKEHLPGSPVSTKTACSDLLLPLERRSGSVSAGID